MSIAFSVEGPVYPIAGNVDTDTVIKSRHCTTVAPEDLGPHCLEELGQQPPFPTDGSHPIILCASTFGIGSARIQAPLALVGAGIKVVVATAVAPIFLENCINGGYLLPLRGPVAALPPAGTPAEVRIADGTASLRYDGFAAEWPCALPNWVLAGKGWVDLIAEAADAAGGLAALRAQGFRLDA
jgi:3-isopropylmalate/(R)-2-methylmalate dehydratase small subunit